MSPLLPKEPPSRTTTAFSQDTVTPVTQKRNRDDFSIAAALAAPELDDPTDADARIRNWSPQQVIDWMYSCGIDASCIECFEVHDINGTVLMDLQFDDLRELDIQSFGKRHQLWNAICSLRGGQGTLSPQPTPFQDTSRPCTRNTHRRSPSRQRSRSRNASACQTPIDADATPITPSGGKKRRGRKAPKNLDVITPAESVSIVAIEQLLPKPHKCAKGERCAKWRKQQRELKQLQDENGIGRFPISPTKGGRIYITGDPGNADTAENIVPNVHKQKQTPQQQQQAQTQPEQQQRQGEQQFRPNEPSVVVPSVVASSDLLGPGQMPEFALHEDVLTRVESRDPQENVRQFLNFQHMQSGNERYGLPPTPPEELAEPGAMGRSESVPLFPTQYCQAYPSLQPPLQTPPPHEKLHSLPRLDIPRSASAGPKFNGLSAEPDTLTSACYSATASPGPAPEFVYRLGTPASEMDVPVTAVPIDPVGRDTSSHSVPPNMQYRQQTNRRPSVSGGPADWRRPSMANALPAVKEHEVYSPTDPRPRKSATMPPTRPSLSTTNSSSSSASSSTSNPQPPRRTPSTRDPSKNDPTTQYLSGYGSDCTHHGWMHKRTRTRLLRHEWSPAHFRLKGSQLAMHDSDRLSAAARERINVDDYAIACSSGASGSKFSAAMRAFHLTDERKARDEATAFAFQLVPERHADGKTHHFAVKNQSERIDWMRELMLAQAVQQRGRGYDVAVNSFQPRKESLGKAKAK